MYQSQGLPGSDPVPMPRNPSASLVERDPEHEHAMLVVVRCKGCISENEGCFRVGKPYELRWGVMMNIEE